MKLIDAGDGKSALSARESFRLNRSTSLITTDTLDIPLPCGTETLSLYAPGPMCGSSNEPSAWIGWPFGKDMNSHQLGSARMEQPAAGLPSEQVTTPRTDFPSASVSVRSTTALGSSSFTSKNSMAKLSWWTAKRETKEDGAMPPTVTCPCVFVWRYCPS